jgi:hypothetical protein
MAKIIKMLQICKSFHWLVIMGAKDISSNLKLAFIDVKPIHNKNDDDVTIRRL